MVIFQAPMTCVDLLWFGCSSTQGYTFSGQSKRGQQTVSATRSVQRKKRPATTGKCFMNPWQNRTLYNRVFFLFVPDFGCVLTTQDNGCVAILPCFLSGLPRLNLFQSGNNNICLVDELHPTVSQFLTGWCLHVQEFPWLCYENDRAFIVHKIIVTVELLNKI